MQIQEAAALSWLTDEVQQTLLKVEEQLAAIWHAASAERLQTLVGTLGRVRADIDSFAGAFDLAGSDALCRYSQQLVVVVDAWRAEPARVPDEALGHLAVACQHLRYYLQLKQRDPQFAEWMLYIDYRWLCEAAGQIAHPIHLWPMAQKNASRRHLSEDVFLAQLQIDARDRLNFVVADQAANVDIDQALLAFIRGRDTQAAAQLRTRCDARATEAGERRVQLFGHMLGMVIGAIEQQKIEFDVVLKRILLQSLSWLKGQSDDTAALDELILFVCFAWQNTQTEGADATHAKVNAELMQYAEQALWQPCKGTNYNRSYLGRYSEQAITQIHAQTIEAQKAWAQLCTQDSNPAVQMLHELAEAMVRLFVPARELGSELVQLLTPSPHQASRDIQIEVAAMLLVLEGWVLETHGADDATRDEQLAEMARRLRCVRLRQPTGAYAPWMLALQRKQTQSAASQVVVQVIQEALSEAEGSLNAYWRTKAIVDLTRTDAALSRILGAAYALQFEPFESATQRTQQAVRRLLDGTQFPSDAAQHELTHELAALSLLLDMHGQGAHASGDLLRFASVAAPTVPPVVEITAPGEMLAVITSTDDYSDDADDVPITTLFLEELGELREQGHALLSRLSSTSAEHSDLVDLRRAFHTMKGGAKTVGLPHFGEFASVLEQCLNVKIAEKTLPSTYLLGVLQLVFEQIDRWYVELSAAPSPEAIDANIDYDLSSLRSALNGTSPEMTVPQIQAPAISVPANWLDLPQPAQLNQPAQQDLAALELLDTFEEQQVKTIGHIELSIALFNAYLNEADEWSRQLALALSEWALDDQAPITPQALTWAHALAGSSATVQLTDLAAIAKAVERLIERVTEEQWIPSGLAATLALAAEEIRQLLHQFAAGFLKSSDPRLMSRLNEFLARPLHLPIAEPAAEPAALPALPAMSLAPMNADIEDEISVIFAEEGQELVTDLSRVFRLWGQSTAGGADHKGTEQVQEALRLLHTLKGSARLAQRHDMADIAHQLESDLERLSLPAATDTLHRFSGEVDKLESLLLGQVVQPVLDTAPQAHHAVQSDQSLEPQINPALMMETVADASPSAIAPLLAAQTVPVTVPVTVPAAPLRLVPTGETIRVKSSTVDRLVNQAGEVMIARSRMEAETTRTLHTLVDLGVQTQRLRDQLRELELQTEMQMQSKQAKLTDQASAFDPLELDRFTRTQELTRFMAEAVSDITTLQRTMQQSLSATEDHLAAQRRHAIDMQRYLLSTRMVEFNSIGERLMRLARVTSQELGKAVDLTITNGALEMDRSVIERMLPAFEHLLRNAIVHGIEPESERLAKGKPAVGAIQIKLEQTGKDVWLTVHDDGRGIDAAAVLAKAQTLYSDLPTQEPLQLIFASGLSTAQTVTELAGRGVGMDVVRTQVQALGGQIDVASELNQGTIFKLILPLTTAVTQIVLVRTASLTTAIPVSLVLTTLRLKPAVVKQGLLDGYLTYHEAQISFSQLAPLIQSQSDELLDQAVNIPVVVLQSAGQTMALQVDEVLGSQEAVVKNLGPQLSQMPGLTGMTVLPSGDTVLIYNPVALANIYGAQLTQQQALPTAQLVTAPLAPVLAPLVLVVDDSITMRRVLQRFLQREGYRVIQAADGRQALDLLRIDKPALVLSDVEMPRMDGFELLRQIRQSERLHAVPVVMITSRMADKHRDHATELGVNAYLGKPYPEAELLELLVKYAGSAKA